ncbi:MAG: glutamine amidotransferase [Methylacidiphilales bacterium]|nr:glutamine amidotransferase [Candidatus Methylacidiphilales bacterium]
MRWFETLFNLPPDLFREGQLTFIGRIPPQALLLVLLALIVVVWLAYRLVTKRTTITAWRTVLALRIALVTVLLFLLGIPAMRLMHGRGDVFTAVLVDTSRSMAVTDVITPDKADPISRMDAARQLLQGEGTKNEGLLKALNRSGKVLVYGFDQDVRRITATDQLKPDGLFTNIFRGVRDMESELRGMPLGAVVLLTDGGRNTGGSTEDAAALLKARGVPLYVIGLGNPNPPNDYEVVRIVAPKRVRRNTEVEVQVTVRHTGYKEPFDLIVNRGQIAIATRKVEPSPDTDLEQVKLVFTPDHEGTATYRIAIPPGKNEKNVDNNTREFVLEIQDDRLPVLYVEGSPRMEYRFLRRALYGDRDFRLVGLLRLGDQRFYVQGANANEAYLAKGFPTTVEQLYAFQAVILGDIEASYFTPAQLAMLEEFVRVRGGGLLMLGGVNSFGLGKYVGTPVAQMLPMQITPNDGPYSDEQYKAHIMQGIGVHPVMRLSLDPEANRTLWSQAPPLIGITPVAGVKAGALTLLTRESDNKPVFAVQNYGVGRVAAFTSGGSWYWRVSVPSSVEFHEKFWKQLVRWLAIGAKERLTAETDADVYAPSKPVIIRATALAKDLQPVNDAVITATVTDPLGNHEDVSMDWILSEEGVYQARYVPQEEGDYRVAVHVDDWDLKPVETDFRVSEPTVESADAGLKEDALRAMAKIAGGRYFGFGEAGELPAEIAKSVQGARFAGMKSDDREIWDMPFLFVLAFGLMAAEWIIRRRSGLA